MKAFFIRLTMPYRYYKARYLEAKQDRLAGDFGKQQQLVEDCAADYRAAGVRTWVWVALAALVVTIPIAVWLFRLRTGWLWMGTIPAAVVLGLLLISEWVRRRAIMRLDRHHMRNAISDILRRENR